MDIDNIVSRYLDWGGNVGLGDLAKGRLEKTSQWQNKDVVGSMSHLMICRVYLDSE